MGSKHTKSRAKLALLGSTIGWVGMFLEDIISLPDSVTAPDLSRASSEILGKQKMPIFELSSDQAMSGTL